MLLLLYGICIFPAWDGNLHVLLGLFAVSTILCLVTRGFMPNRFIVDGEKTGNRCVFPENVYKHRGNPFGPQGRPAGFRNNDPFIWCQLVVWRSRIFLFYCYRTCVKFFARRSDNRILITTIRHGNFIIAPDDPVIYPLFEPGDT